MTEPTQIIKNQSIIRSSFNPFPGLRPFNIEDSHLFFGREGQSDELLKKLADNRFVAVIGASGSGKSSLMFCGLVPTLQGGFINEAGSNWKIITTRPGGGPIENLANALAKTEFSGVLQGEEPIVKKALTQAVLRNSSMGLVEAVKQLNRAPDESILLLVDQFEELFRFKTSKKDSSSINESSAFVKLLLEAIKQKEVPIYIVLTMRSDFIGDCSQFPELTKKINDSHYLIPQMTRANLKEAISGPVAVGGGKISQRLVQELLNDVGDNQDQLPILQHSLMRTWDYWIQHKESEEDVMDIEHYEAIGKMEKALSEHANEAYDELSENEKKICESLFKSITERGSDSRGTRHPEQVASIAQICQVSEQEVIKVVDGFRRPGRSLLTPSNEVALMLSGSSIIDISHESLMRIWDRLKTWVEEEAASVQLYQRLSDASAMYQLGKTSLWRPPDLLIAQNWKEKQNPTLAWAQRYNPAFERTMVFLDTSIKEYETEEQNKIKLQKRALQRARVVNIVVSSFAVVALFLMVYAFTLQQEADKQKVLAVKSEEQAKLEKVEADKQRLLAQEKQKEAQRQKEEADKQKQIALEQQKIALENATLAQVQKSIAEKQTVRATNALGEAKKEKERAEKNADEATKQKINAEKANVIADQRRMQSIAQSMAVKSLKIDKDTNQKALIAYQAFLLNSANDGKVHNPDIYDGLYYAVKLSKGDTHNALKGHTGPVRSMAVAPYSSVLYSAGSDGKILKWALTEGEKKSEVIAENKFINRTLAISSNSQWLACGSEKTFIQLFTTTADKGEPKKLIGHKDVVMSLAFTPNNKHLVSGSADSTVLIWDMNSFTSKMLGKCTSKVNSIAVDPKGKTVIAGTEDGKVLLWNIDGGEPINLPNTDQKKNSVYAVIFNSDGSLIASGDIQGNVKIWDAKSKELITTLVGYNARITDIKFSPDGKMLAGACFDGSIQLWMTENFNDQPIVLKDNKSWVMSMEFSANGDKIFAGLMNNQIKIYSTNTKAMTEQICSKLKRNMTQKEWNNYVGKDIPYQKTCPGLPNGDGVK